MSERTILTAAIFNASDDTVAMLKEILAGRGFRAFGGRADHVKSGELNFVEFLATHKPDVIVWDIAPPYDRNWNFFQLLRTVGPLQGCGLVLTTTHKQHLGALAGEDTRAIEIVGKPYDLEAIADAVVRSVERRAPGPRRLERAQE
jgi:CheY-like chemotaxis protein